MQTFLPYKSFLKSAQVLDRARLGKQRVEVLQLLNALLSNEKSRWKNHPAALMWKGYELALGEYGFVICAEWRHRGYKSTIETGYLDVFINFYMEYPGEIININNYPPWLGKKKFHSSHRSNLLRKDSKHYGKFGWKEKPDLPYYWPVRKE